MVKMRKSLYKKWKQDGTPLFICSNPLLTSIYREVKLTLCSVDREDLSISTGDVTVINEALELLKPFEEATRELSADTYISLSKVVPLARSLQRLTNLSQSSLELKNELLTNMARKCNNIEGNYILSVSALLDPRFKMLAFGQALMYQSAVEKLSGKVTLAQSKETSEQSAST